MKSQSLHTKSPYRNGFACKVSIILPLYNGKRFIRQTIKSILFQSFKNFELLIVDDGSTDGTGKIVKSIRDSRIRYIRLKKNKGPSCARNTGLRRAAGEYIAYCDCDDIWYRNHLKEMIRVLDRNPDVGLAFAHCHLTGFLKPPGSPSVYPTRCSFSQERLENENCVGSLSHVMHRKICIDRVGAFDERESLNRHCYEDWDLWLRISDAFKFRCVRAILGKYVFHGGNRSRFADTYGAYVEIMEKRMTKYKLSGRLKDYALCVLFKFSLTAAHNDAKVWRKMSRKLLGFKACRWRNILEDYCAGIDFYLAGAFSKAKRIFDKCLRHFVAQPQLNSQVSREANLALNYFRAKCESESGHLKSASQLHRQNLKIDPNHLPSSEQMALIGFRAGKYKSAWRHTQKLSRPFYYNLKGACLMKNKHYRKAISFFKKALAADPRFTPAQQNLTYARRFASS